MSGQGQVRREMAKEAELREVRADYPKLQARVKLLEEELASLKQTRVTSLEELVGTLQGAIIYHERRIQRTDYRYVTGWFRRWRDARRMRRNAAKREEAARMAAAVQEAKQAAESPLLKTPTDGQVVTLPGAF